MAYSKVFTGLNTGSHLSFNVLGEERDGFLSFLSKIGFDVGSVLSDSSDVVISAGRAKNVGGEGKLIAYPYSRYFDKSKVKCRKIMTYAIDENNADVVGKNVRFKNDFTAFELLSGSGINRVYLSSGERNAPMYALALACGLMLSGVDFGKAAELISSR